jgi:hypothetical protein
MLAAAEVLAVLRQRKAEVDFELHQIGDAVHQFQLERMRLALLLHCLRLWKPCFR